MKSVSFLPSSWRKKESKPSASAEDPVPPKRTAQTLPRSAIHAKSIREDIDRRPDALVFPVPNSRRNDTQRHTVGNGAHDVFAETSDMSKARQRSRSVGAQYTSQEVASHRFPPMDAAVQDFSPSPLSSVTRPSRKSNLAPIREIARYPERTLPRVSSASSLSTRVSRTLRPKRSMPELDRIWEGFLEDANETLPPTRREFNAVKEVEITYVTRPRSGSTGYDRLSSKPRFSDLPKSPAPAVVLPLISNTASTYPDIDLTTPRTSYFPSELTPSILRSASSMPYLKEGSSSPLIPLQEKERLAYAPQFSTPPEGERPSTSDSTSSEFAPEVTLSMFPKPPPLNLRRVSPTPSQTPLTPDYTPTVTPTKTTFLPSSQFYHVRRPSPPISILKKTSGYYSTPPSPPITPNSPWPVRNPNGSFSRKILSLDPLAPTLKIRNSSPHLSSTIVHSAHRPTSSDSSSDKSAYSVTSDRMDYNLRLQVLSRSKFPTSLETYPPQTLDDIRPHSPETDSQGVQWGYAV